MMSAAQMLPEIEPPRQKAMRPVAVEPPKPVADLLPPANGAPGAARAGDMLANPEAAPGVAARAKMSVGLQQQVGNARMGAMAKESGKESEAPAPPKETKEAKEAKPAAAPPAEKPGEKPAKKSGEDAEKKPAPPSPRKAIAPAVSGVKDRAKRSKTKKVGAPGLITSMKEAAKEPAVEAQREASVATVQNLDSAEGKKVRKQKFKDDLTEAISRHMGQPTTKDQADEVMKTGGKKASAEMHGSLATEREQAAGVMKTAVATEVKPAAGGKAATMVTEDVGAPPPPVSAAPVVPEPLPAERLDYSADRAPTDDAMSEAGVTKSQLEKGNEPEFNKNLSQRADAEKHEAEAEAKYRKSETVIQGQTRAAAQGELAEQIGGMHGDREVRLGEITGQQNATKTKDAAERERVTTTITSIKTATRKDFEKILTDMEAEASDVFDAGLRDAEKQYEDTFEEEKGGVGTWLTTWGDDWDELIERSLATAKRHYLRIVGNAIDRVSEVVDSGVVAAKKRVEAGRKEVDDFVQGLEGKVKDFGVEAQKEVESDFATMETEIDQRRDALIDKLAQQYKASYERMSAKEEALREANKSLWKRIYDATIGLIKKILAFKDMLMSILAKAAEVVVDIITDPIGFLGNLVSAVMRGLENFMKNIGEHLQRGLMEWLFGALAGSGLVLPESFDLKGIISIVLQVLGLTYANFRARAVAIVGEDLVSALEQTAEVFKIVMTQGVSGLWEFIKEKLADLKSMVMDAIFDFIKERVIIAGVTWIIGLLNPASAFFKACKAIYDIVMFFINRGSQIIALVNAVIDSVAAIAKGNLESAIKMVENALAKAIPVAIGFLSALLGLGDISGTVKKTIESAQEPVNKAIDWVIQGAVKAVKAVGNLVGGALGKKEKPPDPNDPQKGAKVEAGLIELHKAEAAAAEHGELSPKAIKKVTKQIRKDHPVFTSLEPIPTEDGWKYEYTASPGEIEPSPLKRKFDDEQVYAMVLEIAEERFGDALIEAAKKRAEGEKRIIREEGEPVVLIGAQLHLRGQRFENEEEERPKTGSSLPILIGGDEEENTVFARQGRGVYNYVIDGLGRYPEITAKFRGHGWDAREVAARVMRELKTQQEHIDIKRFVALIFGAEPSRLPIATVTGVLTIRELQEGKPLGTVFGDVGAERETGGGTGPLTERRAAAAARQQQKKAEGADLKPDTDIDKRRKEHVQKVVEQTYNAVKGMDLNKIEDLRDEITKKLDEFAKEVGASM